MPNRLSTTRAFLTQTQNSAQLEINDARGSRSDLNTRITAISNFTSPNVGGIIVGNYYDSAQNSTSAVNATAAADRVEMSPFITSNPLRIDQIGVLVNNAVASAVGKCFIYSSSTLGWPDQLLHEDSLDISFASTNYRSNTIDFTFEADRVYWLGVRNSSNPVIRHINTSSAYNFGCVSATSTEYFTVVRRTIAYATALPATWGFVTSDLVGGAAPPSIRIRAAAL